MRPLGEQDELAPVGKVDPLDRDVELGDGGGGGVERVGVDLPREVPGSSRARLRSACASKTSSVDDARMPRGGDEELAPLREVAELVDPVAVERGLERLDLVDLGHGHRPPNARRYCAIPRPHQP